MLHNLALKYTVHILKNSNINSEEQEIYIYSFEILFSVIINLIISGGLIFVTKEFLGGIIWLTVFIVMRQFTGGYHASSHFKCILSFAMIFTMFLGILKILHMNYYDVVSLSALMIAIPIIVIISPVVHKNKPLSEKEKKRFRKRARVLAGILSIIAVSGNFIFPNTKIFVSIALSLFTVAVTGLIGLIKN